MSEYALRLENGADTAPRVRQGDALPMTHAGPKGTRTGLRPDGGGDVSVVSGSMAVQVSPFRAWIDGGTTDAQGGYPFVLDSTRTLSIGDGEATLARTDTVAVVIRDDAYDGSGQTSAQVEVVRGTPGAGAPFLPPTALPLFDVNVPAGVSTGTGGLSPSNLGTDHRTYTAASGGVVPVTGASDRDGLGAAAGQVVWRLDTDRLEVNNGSSWVAVYPSDLQVATTTDDVQINNTSPRSVGTLERNVNPPSAGATYLVTACLDVERVSGTSLLLVELTVNGQPEASVLLSSSGPRQTLSRSWVVSDLPAGQSYIALRASRLNGTGYWLVRVTQSQLIVDRRA